MEAQIGSKVKVHYRGTLEDGSVFDESYDSEPLEFVIGELSLIKNFEEAVIGMTVGEKINISIGASDAYGEWTEELLLEFPKDTIESDHEIEVGTPFELKLADDRSVTIEVYEVKENSVVFDANHKLADQDLNFEIELLSVE